MKTVTEMAREAGFSTAHTLGWPECYVRFAELARADAIADEREACAKVCEATEGAEGKDIAATIRARGNT